MQISTLLAGRRSTRSFAQREVVQEDIDALFEAARWAPSSGNRQPWRYLFRTSRAGHPGMSACLTRGNQWALAAPLLVVQLTRVADGGELNGVPYAYVGCGLSLMSLIVEAESRGLRAHPMAGWIDQPLRAEFDVPADWQPVVVVAVGYEGTLDQLDPALREKELRPRTRRPLAEVMVEGRWPSGWSGPL
ncbi:MAG TPA: nitroreductase family protein [Candidatus Eisenbacteria bacterium]